MNRIYARDTSVQKIDNKIANVFIDENHRQGSVSTATRLFSYALFLKEELVAVVQFCNPRTTRKQEKYSTELIRLCFKKDYRIIGGASKLIKHFIKEYNPADIFTYQDTTGENTKVYENCGFTLVSQDKFKQYLVKNGKTFLTANKKEILGIPYAVKYGPDRILGTKLGEKFHSDGTRKTNIELFIDLGWHIEKTSGDKVYEWFNNNITHYVYKITASDSNKYYYGVSHIKKNNATILDCLNDGYFGSGGVNKNNKFKQWKQKHKNTLIKTVLQTFSKKSDSYDFEKKIIGNKYKTDPLCLNSTSGGKNSGLVTLSNKFLLKNCPIHGITKHSGDSCCKCSIIVTKKFCDIHGLTTHRENECYRCFTKKSFEEKFCKIHGTVLFRGNECASCIRDKSIAIKDCSIHGKTKHNGNSCYKCLIDKNTNIQECSAHGLTKHQGNACCKCNANKSVSMRDCSIHGITKYQGDNCCKCASEKNNKITIDECSIHGTTKHRNNICSKCNANKSVSMRECSTHGLTKHQGDNCCRCVSRNNKSYQKTHEIIERNFDEIMEKIKNGVPANKIAKELKISTNAIVNAIYDNGYDYKMIRLSLSPKYIFEKNYDNIVKDLKNNLTKKEIASKYKINYAFLNRSLRLVKLYYD